MHPVVRTVLERLRLLRPRPGRQDVWAAIDRGHLTPGGELTASGLVKSITLSAVVIRANGQVEDQGVIAEYRKED